MRSALVTPMRGFTAAVAHVVNENPQVQTGGVALGLSGDGPDRCLALSIRHADGTGLVVYLTDLGMGRLGDLIVDTYGADVVAHATAAQGRVQ